MNSQYCYNLQTVRILLAWLTIQRFFPYINFGMTCTRWKAFAVCNGVFPGDRPREGGISIPCTRVYRCLLHQGVDVTGDMAAQCIYTSDHPTPPTISSAVCTGQETTDCCCLSGPWRDRSAPTSYLCPFFPQQSALGQHRGHVLPHQLLTLETASATMGTNYTFT
jgi:hypothetical protein